MATHDLQVQGRERTGKEAAKKLRRDGLIPAVVYGRGGEPVKLTVNARELRDLLAQGGFYGLVNLKYADGSSPDLPAIFKDLQRHPVSHAVSAIDFLRVSLEEVVTDKAPIVLTGEPVGVKIDGGILVQALHDLEISALPQNLPEQILVDVSHLEFNGAPIHVREIQLPEGVTAITDGDETVAVVNPPMAEEVVEPVADVDAASVPSAHGDADTSGADPDGKAS